MPSDLIECSVLSICDDSWLFCLFSSASVSLFHRTSAPFGRPSASFENSFIYCLSTRSVQDTTPCGVLSSGGCHERSEQSRNSQGYMAWCGCHEISNPHPPSCSWRVCCHFCSRSSSFPLFRLLFCKLKNFCIKLQSVWQIDLNYPSSNQFKRQFSALARTLCWLAYLSIHLRVSVNPRHNSMWRSLFMLVLSHSDTHYLNRHMVGCGCHERSGQSPSSLGYIA